MLACLGIPDSNVYEKSARKDRRARYLNREKFLQLSRPLSLVHQDFGIYTGTIATPSEFKMNLFRKKEPEAVVASAAPEHNEDPLATVPKNKWQKIWPVLACGSGLFAEGYVQSVCFPNPILSQELTIVGHWLRWNHPGHNLRFRIHELPSQEQRRLHLLRRHCCRPACFRIYQRQMV